MSVENERIARAAKLCEEAAELIGRDGSFRLRTLVKMVQIEAAKLQALDAGGAGSEEPVHRSGRKP